MWSVQKLENQSNYTGLDLNILFMIAGDISIQSQENTYKIPKKSFFCFENTFKVTSVSPFYEGYILTLKKEFVEDLLPLLSCFPNKHMSNNLNNIQLVKSLLLSLSSEKKDNIALIHSYLTIIFEKIEEIPFKSVWDLESDGKSNGLWVAGKEQVVFIRRNFFTTLLSGEPNFFKSLQYLGDKHFFTVNGDQLEIFHVEEDLITQTFQCVSVSHRQLQADALDSHLYNRSPLSTGICGVEALDVTSFVVVLVLVWVSGSQIHDGVGNR